MTRSILFASLLAVAVPICAQTTLDCGALANSAEGEPAGYDRQCALQDYARLPSPVAAGVSRDPTDTGFAYNMRAAGQGLYSHVLNNFPGAVSVGNPGATFYAWDFDPTGTTLYAIQVPTMPPFVFGTVDTATGAFTSVANVTGLIGAETPSGLTIDPVTGDAYLSSAASLYSFDLATAVATPIGPFGTTLMIEVAMNCDGDMYGHDIGTDSLYSIDIATGAATLIGTHGLAANFAQGMDFDNSDGNLYAAIYTGSGTFTYGTFDLATGAINPLSTNTPAGEWELAIPTTCGTGGLETEPNDNKAEANPVQLPPVSAGGVIVGNSTGSSGTGTTSLDYFRVTTAAQTMAGFYRHRLIITSTTAGHTGTIRGLNQTAGVVGTTDTTIQTSSTATTPQRFLQWYTSETPADIYIRIAGTASTTDDYILDYEVQPAPVIAGPTIASGEPVTITTIDQTTVDTDLWVYGADRTAIPDFGNDDILGGTPAQSELIRTYSEGSYYLAISSYNLANNLPSPADDDWRTGAVLDFPGAFTNSVTTLSQAMNPSIGGTAVPAVKEGAFDVVIVSFDAEPAGPPDPIFANGFECEPGFPGCETPTCEPLQLMQDPSFEATDPNSFANPFWTSTSTNFGTGLCNAAACGTGGGAAGPRTGTFWAWLGGTTSAETTTASQAVTIPAGAPRHLNYWLRIGTVAGLGATMTVKVDGTTVQTVPEPGAPEPAYVQRTVDLSAYADGGSHTILFEYISAGGATSNFNLDDITLECEAP